MNPRPGPNPQARQARQARQAVQSQVSTHPMRVAGEFFAWLWGPSEAERTRRQRLIRSDVIGAAPAGASGYARGVGPAPAPMRRQQMVEQRIEDGRIVLRRTIIEEIEIRPQGRH